MLPSHVQSLTLEMTTSQQSGGRLHHTHSSWDISLHAANTALAAVDIREAIVLVTVLFSAKAASTSTEKFFGKLKVSSIISKRPGLGESTCSMLDQELR